ncbi:AraC family transcriptional regulator N-terminal domain-containing protein [Halomonas elongata]
MTKFLRGMPGNSPYYTRVDGLVLLEARTERHPTHIIHYPALCLVVQGSKWTTFGDCRLDYHSGQAMVVGVEMPGFSQVVEGNDGAPYHSVVIGLDLAIMRQVHEAMSSPPRPKDAPVLGAFVMEVDDAIISCVTRMIRMLADPDGPSVLYPGLMREFCYHLLRGAYGPSFAELVSGTGASVMMQKAIRRIREDYAMPLPLGDLAKDAGLSPSAFHRHFKAITSMTPLGYQKQLRLMEARRLMLAKKVTAEQAAFGVGYASPSQFSRDYKRKFGAPPHRDIVHLEK